MRGVESIVNEVATEAAESAPIERDYEEFKKHTALLERCVYFEFMYGRSFKQIARAHRIGVRFAEDCFRRFVRNHKRI